MSSATLFFGGLFNAGELPFVEEELDLGGSSYGALVAVFGVGFMLGSLSGSRGGSLDRLRRRFLVGVVLTGAGTTLAGVVPVLPAAVVGFALAGLGNGMFLVHERLILQQIVPDQFLARAFGIKDSMASWGFGLAFFLAGALGALLGPRGLLIMAGLGGLAVALVAVSLPGATWGTIRGSEPAADAGRQVEAPAP